MVAAEQTVADPPNPLLIFGAFQTGRNGAAFSAVLAMFDEMLLAELGYVPPPPPGMYTDCDRVFLNPMCQRWCGDASYNAYLSRLWDVLIASHSKYIAAVERGLAVVEAAAEAGTWEAINATPSWAAVGSVTRPLL